MGDPRKQRKTFSGPSHPWQKSRIDEEKEISREYGFRNRKEIWKMKSFLRKFLSQAKRIIANPSEQNEKEKQQILLRLKSLGILDETATIETVLGLTVKDVLERRLQSIVYRKGFARSMLQSRQFIVHEHVSIAGKKITSPGYLVPLSEESQIQFSQLSPFLDDMHPERFQEEKLPNKPEEESKEKDEKDKEAKKDSKEDSKEDTKSKKEEKSSKDDKSEKKDKVKESKDKKSKDQDNTK